MKVYAIMKHMGDGCSWEMEEVEDLYLNKDKAEWDLILLEEANQERSTSYFIRDYPVDTSDLDEVLSNGVTLNLNRKEL